MKKLFLVIPLLVLFTLSVFSQSASFEALCKKYEGLPQVETFGVNDMGTFFDKLSADEESGMIKKFIKECFAIQGQACENGENEELLGMAALGVFFAKFFMDEESGIVEKIVKKCSSFQVLTCENGKEKGFYGDIKAFVANSKLEELITIGEKGDEVKVYLEGKKDIVRQAFVLIKEGDSITCIQVKGKFLLSEINSLIKEVSC